MRKRYSKEQYREWGKEGGSPILTPAVIRAYKQGRLKVGDKVIKPPERKRKRK